MNCALTVALSACLLQSSPDPVVWTGDYKEALRTARQSQRPLLLVIDNRHQPGETFDDRQLAKDGTQLQLLKQYELCRVDASTPYGKKIADVFRAKRFPCTVISDKSSRVIVFRKEGHIAPERWVNTLVTKQNIGTTDPEVVALKPVYPPSLQPGGDFQSSTEANLQWQPFAAPAAGTCFT